MDLAGYRRFDKDEGTLTLEPVTMTPEERDDFAGWLMWYGAMVNQHKDELKLERKKGTRFRLDDYELKRD